MKISFIFLFLFLFILNCSANKISNNHGYTSLHAKFEKIKVNKTNKNDLIKIIGPPSTISNFDQNKWFYIQSRKENQSLQNISDMKREFVGGILRNTVSNLPDDEKNELKEIFKDRLKNGWGASEWSKSDNFCQNILIWEHNYNEIINIIKKSHPQLIKEFDVLANKSVAEISSKIEEEVV